MEMTAAIIFMGSCIFLPMILSTMSNTHVVKVEKEIVEVVKYLPQPIVAEKKINNPIKDDAINCLVSLGMKKADAKKKVNEMFVKTDYKSLESFLLDVYKL